jgi:hypothetical protein
MITGIITGKVIAVNSVEGKIIVDVGRANLHDRQVTIHCKDEDVLKTAASLLLQMASFSFVDVGRCSDDVRCEPFKENNK